MQILDPGPPFGLYLLLIIYTVATEDWEALKAEKQAGHKLTGVYKYVCLGFYTI